MKTRILSAIALSSILALTAQAHVNVQLFTPSTSPSYVVTEDALVDGFSQALHLGATYNYVNRPLVELSSDRKTRIGDLITAMNTIDITGGYYLSERWFLGASLPLNLVAMPGEAQQFAMGDARLMSKIRLTNQSAAVSFALIPELFIPTGDKNLFLSDGSVGGGLKGAVEREFGSFRASANVGYRYTSDGSFRDIRFKNRLSMGLGGNIRLARMWSMNVEGKGTLTLPKSADQNPGEVYAGFRYKPRHDLAFALGGALGAVNGIGSTDYRLIAGVQFYPAPAPAPAPRIVEAPKPAPAPVVSAVKKPAPRVFFEAKEIRITEEIKFLHNSAVLADSGKKLLDEVADVIKKNLANFKTITVEGHTNKIGTHAYNMNLSRQRSAAVKEYLMSRGVEGSRLASIGYGKTRPKQIANLSKEAQLAADRRVEFKVNNYTAAELSAINKKKQAKAAEKTQDAIDATLDSAAKPTEAAPTTATEQPASP